MSKRKKKKPAAKKRRAYRPRFTREALEAIPLWVELGARPPDIAEALGTTVESLAVICSRNNISLRSSGAALLGALTPAQWSALQREAVRRGLPAWKLAARTLAAVAERGLFGALLDPREEPTPARVLVQGGYTAPPGGLRPAPPFTSTGVRRC